MIRTLSKAGAFILIGSLTLGCNQTTQNTDPVVGCSISEYSRTGDSVRSCSRDDYQPAETQMVLTSDRSNQIHYLQRITKTPDGSYLFNVNLLEDGTETLLLTFWPTPNRSGGVASFPYYYQLARKADNSLGFYHYDSKTKKESWSAAPADALEQVKAIYQLADQFVAYGKANLQLQQPVDATLASKIDDLVINQAPKFSKEWDF